MMLAQPFSKRPNFAEVVRLMGVGPMVRLSMSDSRSVLLVMSYPLHGRRIK